MRNHFLQSPQDMVLGQGPY